MDIFNNPVLAKLIIGGGVVVLLILYGIGRMIYTSFSSKRNAPKAEKPKIGEPISNSESIGDISVRLGEDIRDVWEMGYSNDQINGVLTGKYALADMYKMGPEGNTTSVKGREILAKKQK